MIAGRALGVEYTLIFHVLFALTARSLALVERHGRCTRVAAAHAQKTQLFRLAVQTKLTHDCNAR